MELELQHLIIEYLKKRSDEVVEQLVLKGDAAVDAILGFKGFSGVSLPPRDVDDYHLVVLLEKMLRRKPALLLNRPLVSSNSHDRFRLIVAAVGTENPVFADIIIGGLKDRSSFIKDMVVQYLEKHKYLRTLNAKAPLTHMLNLKSLSSGDRDRVQRLLTQLESQS